MVPLVNLVSKRVKYWLGRNSESVGGGEIKCGACWIVSGGGQWSDQANVYFSEWILSESISPRFLSGPGRFEILYVTFLE